MSPASAWNDRYLPDAPAAGLSALDLACGAGRHARLLADRGYQVTAMDRDTTAIKEALGPHPQIEVITCDIEADDFCLAPESFAVVVVSNFLFRPLFPQLQACLKPRGLLLYETFAQGNERFGKPSNPDFLLNPGELLTAFSALQVLAYEDVIEQRAARQRITAMRP